MLCLDELCLFRSSLDDNSPRLRPSSVFLPDTRRGYGARGGGGTFQVDSKVFFTSGLKTIFRGIELVRVE